MTRWVIWIASYGLLACGGTDSAEPEELTDEEVLELEEALADTSRVMEVEPPRRGELSLSGVGSHEFLGRFRAAAGLCQDPRFLQLTVQTDSLDTIFLFHLPGTEEAIVGDYEVVRATEELFEVARVRIGLQLIRGRVGSIFRGVQGVATLAAFDGRVSGHFEAAIEEVGTEAIAKIRGRFNSVLVHDIPEDNCALAAAAFVDVDSVASVARTEPDTL